MKHLSSSAGVFLLWVLPRAALAQQCYYPDGTLSDQIPCNSGEDPTWCCDPGFTCLSNGLCQDRSNVDGTLPTLWDRGSCTDPTWSSPNCVDVCSAIAPNMGAQVWSCNAGLTSYCCDTVAGGAFSQDCCADTTGSPTFLLASPVQIAYVTQQSSSPESSSSSTPSPVTSSPPQSPSPSSPPSTPSPTTSPSQSPLQSSTSVPQEQTETVSVFVNSTPSTSSKLPKSTSTTTVTETPSLSSSSTSPSGSTTLSNLASKDFVSIRGSIAAALLAAGAVLF